jgi:hypothetical protein
VKCNRLEVLLLFSNSLLWLEREREREREKQIEHQSGGGWRGGCKANCPTAPLQDIYYEEAGLIRYLISCLLSYLFIYYY